MGPTDAGLLTQFGIMQKISTGHMVFDMALMFMMPVVMKYAAGYWGQLKQWFLERPHPEPNKYVRIIEYACKSSSSWCSDNDNNRNKVLQDSILMFLDSKPDVVEKFKVAYFKLTTAATEEEDSIDDPSKGQGDEIRRYRVQIAPPENVWFDIEPDIQFMKSRIRTNEGDGNASTVVTFTFETDLRDGQARISDFVDRALAMYKERMGKRSDTARYFYSPQFPKDADNQYNTIILYKRYLLSEEKTFDSFFHPEKEEFLRLVDHFVHKQGKFGIPGYPHKLGLLLHGPPGTGKTSLIKALAQYTHRHIISIPLSRVRTNQELMDLVFDQSCTVKGDCTMYKLPFKKTIFVMEDIDAACDVVKKRSSAAPKAEKAKAPVGPEKVPRKANENGEETAKNADPPASCNSNEVDAKFPSVSERLQEGKGKLNLAGVLNVLDGVVDCPNRIVVMTTNHPEKLDPALIRPGRVNKQLYFGYLRLEEALQMAEHYFGKLAEADKRSFTSVFPNLMISPAALESMCAACDVVDDLVRCIKVEHPERMSPQTPAGCECTSVCGVMGACGAQGKIGDRGEVGPSAPIAVPQKRSSTPWSPRIQPMKPADAQVVVF
ncbi:unnamed protein product [Ostreobium quekettii]|uniref:AAA+ ATPase domain-containing protein n=1 Tax=Ostreobium quekettii TaxID=121088 RepID=A0A8S1J239_9CHLO|nr:unnamed protein product [Ostreobium quekettii]|eukprot:evm.model.scf_285EXC.13 EVM.evm.TU.scf_285EXC.13   scf_285EXC:91851-95102(-)